MTIHGEIVVMPFLAVNGPKGTYYHVWKSLKLQSFSKTNPKTCFHASFTLIGFPSSLTLPPKKAPTSISKSSLLHSLKLGSVASFAFTCPLGLLKSVPLTTTEDALPWYPMGICSQFSFKAFCGPLMIEPTLNACALDE